MLNSRAVFDPLWRATDANGDPIPGAKLKFYLSETTTPMTVYADAALTVSLGTTVTCDSGGYPTSDGTTKQLVYVGVQDFKIVVTDADDVTVVTHDKQQGAVDPNDLPGGGGGSTTVSIEAGAGDYTVNSADAGKLLNRSSNFVLLPVGAQTISHAGRTSTALAVSDGSAGASDDITLPSAVTVGDGFHFGAKHSGTGEIVWLASDGANWVAINARSPWLKSNAPLITVADRLTSAPASPNPGALYIVNGTPSGVWATLGFDQHDVLEADGSGGWIEHNPQDGWLAYVADESLLTQYRGSAWVDLSNITAPTTTTVPMAIWEHKETNGTDGGTATSGSRQTRSINYERYNSITGASLNTGTFEMTLPAGDWDIEASSVFNQTGFSQVFFKSTTTATEIASLSEQANTGTIINVRLVGTITLAAAETFKLESRVGTSKASNGFGTASSYTDGDEIYARVVVRKRTSQQGPQGTAGPQGAAGSSGTDGADAGYGYTWSSDTSETDPGSGTVKGNNATLAAISKLFISETDGASGNLASEIASLDDNTSTVRAKVKISDGASGYLVFAVTAASTDNGAWVTLNGSVVASTGTLSGSVRVLFLPTGDQGIAGSNGSNGSNGATGATGATAPAPLDYTFDTSSTADADPGAGKWRANSATAAAVTMLYVDDVDRFGNSQAALLATWDDSTSSGAKGTVYITDLTTPANRWVYDVTAFTAAAGYSKLTVTHRSGAAAFPAGNVGIIFVARGDKGSDGSGTGDFSSNTATSVDGEIVLFSGTAGKTGKRATTTGVLKADSGVLAAAVSGTDYAPATSGTSILKANGSGGFANAASGTDYAPATSGSAILKGSGSGGFSAAISGTDYAPATSGSAVLKGNGSGGFASAVSGTDYAPATSGSAILKGNGSGGFASAAAGTDYQAPIGTISGIAKGNGANALTAATAGTDYVAPATATNFTAQQYFGLATLTDGANIAWDVSTKQKAAVTLGGNRTMDAVSNAVEGATYLLWAIQDATGSRILTWTTTGAGSFDFGTDGAPTLTTTASKADLLGFEAKTIGGTLKLRFAGIKKGFG